MNGDERQGDANPISNREKRNATARDLRVQSQVHLVMPPNLISSARDKGKSEGQDLLGEESSTGTVHPERRLYSIRTEAGGRRRERRRGRAELPRRCSPPRWWWSGVVEQSQAGRRIPTTSGDIARVLLPRLDRQGSGGARPSSVPNGVAAARRPLLSALALPLRQEGPVGPASRTRGPGPFTCGPDPGVPLPHTLLDRPSSLRLFLLASLADGPASGAF